ncbi:MAG: gas vesicle protein K [Candidatus Omnitrophota bacterium]|nr:gas vesicle protein K [Candidatus Omnitrophota bacterium]
MSDRPVLKITVKEPREAVNSNSERINIDPKNVEKGLAKLVLTLVELLRKLLEKQAMRRVNASSLSDEEVERVGEALMKLEEKMKELKEIFGLKDEDLNINLGPLGDLM